MSLPETDASRRYAGLFSTGTVRDRPLLVVPRAWSELELQARWFAGDFGRNFASTTGEPVRIVQFGVWNREAGPDFSQAALEVGSETRLLRGAVELDLADRNWETHGHSTNPAFDDTILHVFFEHRGEAEFFTRTSAHRNVIQVRLDPSAVQNPLADFVPLAQPGRCVGPLQHYDDARVTKILRAAAEFRLHRKAQRLRQRIAAHGRAEAVFQSLADALGYKENRFPFNLLAQFLPVALLRRSSAAALLFGLAGFLNPPAPPQRDSIARSYARSLWDDWWKEREDFARLILPSKLWKMGGARPLNHPHRRLGALAAIVRQWKTIYSAFGEARPAALEKKLADLHDAFWATHYTLASKPMPKPQALIGRSRIVEILANVYYPLALLEGRYQPEDYAALRAELSNTSLETAGARVFADPQRARKFQREVMGQQGLLQIYEDFCQRDASDCAACPFPEQLRQF